MRTLLLHDPVIRRLASNGKVKSAATRGPCLSCIGSAPQAGVFSGFQYLTVPLHLFPDAEDLGRGTIDTVFGTALAEQERNQDAR